MINKQCECINWARLDITGGYPNIKGNGVPFVATNHHPRCEHYNDSLIDVWKVSYDGQSFYQKTEPQQDELEGSETVTKERMHSEIFDQLAEFNGF